MVTPVVSVLTVDDYEPTRYARTRALRALGCRVLEAKDGRTALELAVRERPDILLLDVHLPDLHGFEVCQQLKADPRTADIPVIHVSATGRGDRFRRESAAVGAFAYLQEPVSPDELLRVMRLALDASRKVRNASSVVRERAGHVRTRSGSFRAPKQGAQKGALPTPDKPGKRPR